MDFDLGKEEIQIRQRLHELIDPNLDEWLSGLGSADLDHRRRTLLSAFEAVASSGYTEFVFEGKGRGAAVMAVREELAFISPSLYLSVEGGNGLLVQLLGTLRTDMQENRVLPSLMSCKAVGSVALVEDHGNIEDNPFGASIEEQGNSLCLSAEKNMVVNAGVADWIAVAATYEGRLAFALISPDPENLEICNPIAALGLEPSPFYQLCLNKFPVSLGELIGPFETSEPLSRVRMWEDQVLVGASLGIMRRAYEAARDHSKAHRCGGKPLVAYQEVGFKLAEMLTLIHTAQLLAYRAAWIIETGDREAEILVHSAKVFCAESAESVASGAIQILGQMGYSSRNPAEQAYRDAKFIQLGGTSTERSRIKIGDKLLEAI
ncbi:MAG: hypothetical protein DRH12_09195 [Deltaproteobacteria bacterium]|nr:MAG: hypothetical protein DRH12_09195 [Deltaproteobacteria bacterium]